jgi:hypothetical protein
MLGQHRRAIEFAERALAAALEANDAAAAAMARQLIAVAFGALGERDRARRRAAQGDVLDGDA